MIHCGTSSALPCSTLYHGVSLVWQLNLVEIPNACLTWYCRLVWVWACTWWQESQKNGRLLCELLVLFSSCGTLSTGSRTDDWPLPRQTIPFTSQLHNDIIHQAHPLTSPMTALTFNETKPHHPSRATSSSRAIWEVSSRISAEIHGKLANQDLGFKISFEPKLVHH